VRSASPFRLLVAQVDAPPPIFATLSGACIESGSRCHSSVSFDQQRLYLFRGCVLHMRQNMTIDVERERHAGMSQLFTDDLWGTPAISEMVAAVWRRSYSLMDGNSADLSKGLKCSCTKRDSRIGPPRRAEQEEISRGFLFFRNSFSE
jgi:hypothetical protein